MGSRSSKVQVLDPVSWLSQKEADNNFINHVKNVMNGVYDPIEYHPKISNIISGYLHSLNSSNNIIPTEIESVCMQFLRLTNTKNIQISEEDAKEEITIEIEDNVNNTYEAETLSKDPRWKDYGFTENWPKNIILTVIGDLNFEIENYHRYGMIVLNVIGNCNGSARCKYNGNIFIKCHNYSTARAWRISPCHIICNNDTASDYYRDEKYWTAPYFDENVYKYGNMVIVCDQDMEMYKDNLYTRNVVVNGYYDIATNGYFKYSDWHVLDACTEYKKMRLKYNKNLFGNVYIKVGGEFSMSEDSKIESGSIYLIFDTMKDVIKFKGNRIRAGRGNKTDLIIFSYKQYKEMKKKQGHILYPVPKYYYLK